MDKNQALKQIIFHKKQLEKLPFKTTWKYIKKFMSI